MITFGAGILVGLAFAAIVLAFGVGVAAGLVFTLAVLAWAVTRSE